MTPIDTSRDPSPVVSGEQNVAASIARLDQEWEAARQKYVIKDRGGHYIAGQGCHWGPIRRIIGAVYIIVFVTVWMGFAISIGPPYIFPLVGLAAFSLMFIKGVNESALAKEYKKAEAAYRAKREELLRRQN